VVHTFSLYGLRVTRGGDDQPLGNVDGDGTALLERIAVYLKDVEHADGEAAQVLRSVRTEGPTNDEPSTVTALVAHGRSGVRSDFYDPEGQLAFERTTDHNEQLSALALFVLPALHSRGVLVLHNPHGRGVKSVLTDVLRTRFNEDFPERGVALHVDPLVPAKVLEDVMEEDGLKRIVLVKHEPSADRFDNLGGYVDPADVGRIETHVVARPRRFLRRGHDLATLAGDVASGTTFMFGGADYDDCG
jgi:hypothetical protein